MAKTRERKLEVARKIYDIVVGEYGLAPEDLIYDALTFTLATGDAEWIDSGKETVEGIRLIKRELPGVSTILGVSNVSFGLTPEARGVLNSVFLHHCVQAGLDAAIVNPAHIRPYAEISTGERELADDLVFNKRADALQRFIEYFANVGGGGASAQVEKEDPTAGMTAEQKIHWMFLHRKKEGIEEQLDAAGVRENPVRVLNEVLLPAMKEVGDKFGAGELILPFVLQSAEVMKRAVARLENYLDKIEGYTKGTVVLATVFGDVHDIGKSLVNTILTNNGYTVIDLGKQVPVQSILDATAFREKGAEPVEDVNLADDSVRSPARTDVPIPAPPFWGVREIPVPLEDVYRHLDTHVLFKLHWGGRGVKGEAWQTLLREDFRPRLERMWREQDYLHPRALLGFFPCYSLGNEIVVL